MFDEKPPVPLLQQLFIHMLTAALTALAFAVSFLIWRQTLESVLFRLIADTFVARFIYMSLQVAMAFAVVLMMLVGEPWLNSAREKGHVWMLFLKIAGGLAAFGAIGLVIDTLLTR
jgi:hypothetical protein